MNSNVACCPARVGMEQRDISFAGMDIVATGTSGKCAAVWDGKPTLCPFLRDPDVHALLVWGGNLRNLRPARDHGLAGPAEIQVWKADCIKAACRMTASEEQTNYSSSGFHLSKTPSPLTCT
eukprot:1160414-Pelagomonas_calceolata.AAC.2